MPEIARLHGEDYGVYGVRNIHALMRRQGWEVGRDQTARLMMMTDVRGAKRTKRVFTTKSDPAAVKPADLVQRRFHASAPRRLRVAHITYVATWSGFASVVFVSDVYSRRIVGWNVAATLKTDIPALAGPRHFPPGTPDVKEPLIAPSWSITPTTGRTTCRSSTPTASARWARSHRPGPSVTPLMTRLLRPSTGSGVPSSSAVADRGARSSRSRSRPSSTRGGGTSAPPRRDRHEYPARGRGGVLRCPRITPAGTRWPRERIGTNPGRFNADQAGAHDSA